MLYRENSKYIKREDFIRLGECSVRLNNEQFVPTEFIIRCDKRKGWGAGI